MPPDRPGLALDAEPKRENEARSGPRPAAVVAREDEPKPKKPTRSDKRQVMVARRVRRVLRRLDPWSVLKVSLVFYVCGYIVTMVAGVLLWTVASRADMITKLEDFVEELGAYERFELLPDVILERALLIGAILTVVATGLTVLAAILFNLISDLVGGIRVVVIEEESARPVSSGRASAFPGAVPNPDRGEPASR